MFIFLNILIALFIKFVYPNYISPAFSSFEDLVDRDLRQDINELATNLKFPLKNILISRFDHSNSYLYGIGKNKIVLKNVLL